jgi:hypothetical protein
MALFVAGGGFTTMWFGLLAGIAATQITAPPARWRTWLGSRLTRLLARLWPWLLIAYLAWAAGSWIVAAVSNAVMLRLTPAVTAATPLVLVLILLSPSPVTASKAKRHNNRKARHRTGAAARGGATWPELRARS